MESYRDVLHTATHTHTDRNRQRQPGRQPHRQTKRGGSDSGGWEGEGKSAVRVKICMTFTPKVA